jgi:hypothetical protein
VTRSVVLFALHWRGDLMAWGDIIKARIAAANPYAAREVTTDPERADVPVMEAPQYAVPQHGAYAAPPIEAGDAYNDTFGWGPRIHTSTVETPSAQRLGVFPRVDYRPDPVRPADEGFYAQRDADEAKRHSVEEIDANGWTENKGIKPGDQRWAPNPRLKTVPESRVTQQMAPRSYSFTRPFDQHSARTLNGLHFSMADHRRNYEILGMAPARRARNTYRIEPTPWDVDIVDMPPPREPATSAVLQGVELPESSRAYRLGG